MGEEAREEWVSERGIRGRGRGRGRGKTRDSFFHLGKSYLPRFSPLLSFLLFLFLFFHLQHSSTTACCPILMLIFSRFIDHGSFLLTGFASSHVTSTSSVLPTWIPRYPPPCSFSIQWMDQWMDQWFRMVIDHIGWYTVSVVWLLDRAPYEVMAHGQVSDRRAPIDTGRMI